MHRETVALDFSTLDHLSPVAGQYRYAVSLINGLAALASDMNFVLLGSRAAPVDEVKAVFTEKQSRWRYIQVQHAAGRGSYWRDQIRYARLLRRQRIGLFHCLHGHVALLAPCPVVITQYDLTTEIFAEYAENRVSRPYRINRWAVRNRARRTICISETTAADMRNLWHMRPDRLDVIYLGNHLALRGECAEGNGDGHAPQREAESATLLSAYNLEPRKNLAALLEATAQLKPRYRKIRLVLFGRAAITPERERIFERKVAELGIDAEVKRIGIVDDAELAQQYRSAHVFVLPTLYEGFGFPVLEAMACGACVVARNASAMAEILGDAGLLVETRDVGVLAQAIADLLEDPARRRSLSDRAVRRAATFTVERMARLTYRCYQRALGGV
jgi:glycosyltransferase involved in cell wall biosynthesis